MTSKKVLINLTSLVTGGLFPQWLIKFKYFQDHGYKLYILCHGQIYKLNKIIDVYSFAKTQKFYQKLPRPDINKIDYLLYVIKTNLYSILNIRSILRENFDIIYSPTSVLDLIIIPFLLKILRPKIIWVTTFDNIVPLFDPGNYIIRLLAYSFFQISLLLIKQSNQIFAISSDLKKYLIKNKINQNKITISGNAIETETLIKAKKNKYLNYDSLYIGRINETKGIYDLLEVINIVTKTYPNFVLAIMGEGDPDTMNEFKQKISNYKLNSNIKLLGFKTGIEKYSIIKSSKIFVFLSKSKSESFGISLLEAVSCGLPAITYKLPPYKHLYKHQEIYSYPIGSINKVAEKIIDIIKSKKYINYSGKKLLGLFTWDKIAKIEFEYLNSLK